jgi:hypothetical protein
VGRIEGELLGSDEGECVGAGGAVTALRCVSLDTCWTLEELLAVFTLGEFEVETPPRWNDEGPVSGKDHVVFLVVFPVGREGPGGISGGAARVGAKL